MSENQRPTYWDIALEYLREGYRAWQAGDAASGTAVSDRMGLSVVETLDFRNELQDLGLIAVSVEHDDPWGFRLLPRGIALMDGSPSLNHLLTLPSSALDRAAPTPGEAEQAKGRWRTVVMEWATKKGLDTAWDNRQALWHMLRAGSQWLPDFPGTLDIPV